MKKPASLIKADGLKKPLSLGEQGRALAVPVMASEYLTSGADAMRVFALLALLALSACATPEQNCALATGTAIALDLGGSWATERHYADAAEICE